MAWSKGQPWRVVRSLDRLNAQIRAAYPQATPPATPATSWGSIADSAHSSTSDHYPHYYSALGATAVVCARDFPHAPALGLDAHDIAEQLRLSQDPRIAYVISNGRITGPNYGWRWATYGGSDPHDTHIHVSTVHTAVADSDADWQIGDDDMPTAKEVADALLAADLNYTGSGATALPLRTLLRNLHQQGHGPAFPDWQETKDVAAVKAQLAALTITVGKLPALIGAEGVNPTELAAALDALPKVDVDEQAIISGILSTLTPEAIAAAIPPEMADQVADELAARLAGASKQG